MPMKMSPDRTKRNTMQALSCMGSMQTKGLQQQASMGRLFGFQGKQNSQGKINASDYGTDDFESWMKSRALLKPDDQLELTEAELNEEISKVLTIQNTNVVKNLVIYSFTEGGYVPVPPVGNTVTLFNFEGTALHLESEEAQNQILEQGDESYLMEETTKSKARASIAKSGDEDDDDEEAQPEAGEAEPEEEGEVEVEPEAEPEEEEGVGEDAGEGGEGTEAGEAGEEEDEGRVAAPQPGGKKRKLINQFNYCERAALTYNNPSRSVETQTIPPPRSTYGGNVLQWVIYDSYAEDYAQQQKEKEKEKKPGAYKKEESKKKSDKNQATEELNKRYLQCWQILERMINQNIYDDIAQDYRYWEDPSDEFREEEGTLLPLWKFSYEKTKKMTVTDICFNTLYYDLFAVCFGSFDFMKQFAEGAVCLFTIKNPSFPDYRITCESGVMCCDIHPKYPFLLAIGLYDGNVAVYNLQIGCKDPIYMSQGVNGKHAEFVSEIKWGPDLQDGEINFYSISGDGKVFNWVLMQNKLSITTIITLFLEQDMIRGPDGTEIKLKGCGSCMTFHPTNREIFLVGTEEGFIYKCSTAYSSKYLMTYPAHYLSVYRIDFNKFNSNIFASCSGDWRVKVWEDMRSDPLFIFDLGSRVGDVKWAPYSSTVLAAVTSDGKAVVSRRKNQLTRLAFNDKLPFIIVGDDKGTTTSLKLSPNLRLRVKPPKKQQNIDQNVLQVQKLEKLLSLVRELPEGKNDNDTATTVGS
ncbi:dynein intermediate chain 2, ciliary isoform X3 [Hermetia illucens]|uniref:dynein intermediate chain 2, ciliary isoform X3 n=1 Tax=Hermetia illucens TaxID=343691 RepID=UPI0018CC6132|nr:dynein intermediate chain 2, ciliary isoform X3 [Hermetia illucens]